MPRHLCTLVRLLWRTRTQKYRGKIYLSVPSIPLSEQACKPAGKPEGKQASRHTGTQASRQAGKQGSALPSTKIWMFHTSIRLLPASLSLFPLSPPLSFSASILSGKPYNTFREKLMSFTAGNSLPTRWALSILSLNGKKASELRATPFKVAIHFFLSP